MGRGILARVYVDNKVVTVLGRWILARVYAGDKWLWDWVAGFQPAFMQVTSGYGIGSRDSIQPAFTQVTSGYGIGSRDSSPRLRR
jgi:hypothetical protein